MGLPKQNVAKRIQKKPPASRMFTSAVGVREGNRADSRGADSGGQAGRRRRSAARRRGVVTLWLIVSLPVLALLLIVVIEIGNLWLARVELENALESAALAAVKQWGDSAGTDNAGARAVGVTYAGANTVAGDVVLISDNLGGTGNMNATPNGNLIFGAMTTNTIPWVFNAQLVPDCSAGRGYGVRAQASVNVNSVCANWLGTPVSPFSVSASVTAKYGCVNGRPELIRVQSENYVP